jgi:hypothetical protein
VCNDSHATHDPNSDVQCNYKRKTTLAAFLFNFFLGGVGGGYWYLGLTGWALANLLTCVVGGIIMCVLLCVFRDNEVVYAVCAIIWFLAIVGLWLASWGMILSGHIDKDGRGVKLYSNM